VHIPILVNDCFLDPVLLKSTKESIKFVHKKMCVQAEGGMADPKKYMYTYRVEVGSLLQFAE